jgi:hypothetical protein
MGDWNKKVLVALTVSCLAAAGKAQTATALGGRLEVLWDMERIERLDNVRLTLHPPKLREVALVHDKPWEGNVCCYHTVFKDGGLYRMYYRGAQWGGPAAHPEVTCYAESDDGIVWRKPELGLIAFKGSSANNIVWDKLGSHNFAPFLDSNPACPPDQRYKALGNDGTAKAGLIAFVSADAVRWRVLRPEPVITKGAFDSQNVAFWDTTKKTYVAYFRDFQKGNAGSGVRAIKICASADFVAWTEPEWLTYAEGTKEEELYTNALLPYPRAPRIYVGFPKRFVANRTTPWDSSKGGGIPGLSDGVFMSSRDGRRFNRWERAFLRPGLQRERWVNRNNMTAWGLVETAPEFPGAPSEFSLYSTENYYSQTPARLRRMTVRQDGFVSVQADEKGGTVTTKPLTFSAQKGTVHLLVNLSTSVPGQLRCEIRGQEGRPLPGFALADCVPLYGDGIELPVAWKNGADVAALAGQAVALHFELKDADLFAYRFGQPAAAAVLAELDR